MSWFGWGTRSVEQPGSRGTSKTADYPPGTEIHEDTYNLLGPNEQASWLFSRSESVQTGWNEYETRKYYTKYSSPQAAAEALARGRAALAAAQAAKDASHAEWLAKEAAKVVAAKAEAKAVEEWAEKHPAKPSLPWAEPDDKVERYVSREADKDYSTFTDEQSKRLLSLVKYNDTFPQRLNKDPNEDQLAKYFLLLERNQLPWARESINKFIRMFNNNGIDGGTLGKIFEDAIRFVKMETNLLELKGLEESERHTTEEIGERALSQIDSRDLLLKLEDIIKKKETLVKKIPVEKKIPVANNRQVVPRPRRGSFGGGRTLRKTRRRHKKRHTKRRK